MLANVITVDQLPSLDVIGQVPLSFEPQCDEDESWQDDGIRDKQSISYCVKDLFEG